MCSILLGGRSNKGRGIRAMKKTILAVLGAALATTASAQPGDTTPHYYSRPTAAAGAAHPWLILLPGGGGMDVNGDRDVYFDKAAEWNAAGWDVLLVHYQEAAKLLPAAASDNPAKMEAAVVADALRVAGEKGLLDLQCPGMVMGFSMGGAGTLALAAAPPVNLIGAIGFYPLTRGQAEPYAPKVPLLVLQGDLDQATPRATLDALVAGSTDRSKITVFHLPSAHHAFDIPSLAEPWIYNGMTFEYQNGAALKAQAEVESFRTVQLARANAPAECRN